jgi:class 3 adenylate cyclase
MAASSSERASLFAVSEGGPISLLFAATHPERVNAIVLYETFVRYGGVADYPIGMERDAHQTLTETMVEHWGTGLSLFGFGTSQSSDPRIQALWGQAERSSNSPGGFRVLYELIQEVDVRPALQSVQSPCLVIHGEGSMFAQHGEYLAGHLPKARLEVMADIDHFPWFSGGDRIVAEVEEFLTEARSAAVGDRVLATVLFTDIVGSTDRAAQMGDQKWRQVLASHDDVVRRQFQRFRGKEIKTTGDGFLATFDGPARAIRCALTITEAVQALGLQVRAGLHTGEVEMTGGDIGGIAVHIASRVLAHAGAGEVTVSSSVPPLVVGSGIEFEDRGEHELKGVPGAWRLFAVEG